MPRAARRDDLGAFHHVMNRGLARRPVFESTRDRRYFLALLARAVRSGAIELHEFTLLSTHYHLLVRSVRGELSKAIGLIAWRYVRWFNRGRDRDGSLFRARFTSRLVDHDEYERAVRVYIADNAVAARLVARPVDYRWCSTHWRAAGRGRRWIAKPLRPMRSAGAAEIAHSRFMVEQRTAPTSPSAGDPWRTLATATEPQIVEWLRHRARIADGREQHVPSTSPPALDRALARARLTIPLARSRRVGAVAARDDLDLRCGLLRELCGLSWRQISKLTSSSSTTAFVAAARHAERLVADREYVARVGAIARTAIAQPFEGATSGPRRHRPVRKAAI